MNRAPSSVWSRLLLLLAALSALWSASLVLHPVDHWIVNIQLAGLALFAAIIFGAFSMDLRRRAQAVRALHASEARAQLIVSSAQDGIITMDEAGLIGSFNPAAERMFGYAAAEITGRKLDVLLPLYRWELSGKEGRVALGRRNDGSTFPVELMTGEAMAGGRRIYSGILRDITERTRAEEALRRERNFVSAILDTAGALVVVIDVSGRIVRFNRACEETTGYRLDLVSGKRIWDIFLAAEETAAVRSTFDRVMAGEYPSKSEHYWITSDGARRLISWSITALADREGKVEYAIAIGIDVTERKRLEEQLLHAQKMDAVGRLAGGVAHDFNNLLTAITGYSELLMHALREQDPLRKDVEEIRRAGERAASLTRQLLAFSRKQVLQPKVLDLNTVVRDMEKMLRRVIGENIELATSLDPRLGRVKADPGQIEQVVLNLAVNARDAMPRGGKLIIETGNVVLNELYGNRHVGVDLGSYAMVAVTDTGCGMDAETQSHLFEPFFTTKELGRGTGLGLSTVYGIVTQSGGKIWVYSEPGHGTTFKIYLPRVQERSGEPIAENPVKVANGSETILLVEDEDEVRGLIRKIVHKHGYTVIEARAGDEALQAAQSHPGPIHLLLTDIVMPRIGGPELARMLHQVRPGTKVLFMSGYPDGAVQNQRLLEPGAAFIQKPFSPSVLAVKIREVLDAEADPSALSAPAVARSTT